MSTSVSHISLINTLQLLRIVDNEDQLFIGNDFQYLDAIIDQVSSNV